MYHYQNKMAEIIIWLIVSFFLALFFLFTEGLILAVGINNLHYALYFCVLGIVGFLCRYQALKLAKKIIQVSIWYKIGDIVVFGILTVGCIALLANIVILIVKKI